MSSFFVGARNREGEASAVRTSPEKTGRERRLIRKGEGRRENATSKDFRTEGKREEKYNCVFFDRRETTIVAFFKTPGKFA